MALKIVRVGSCVPEKYPRGSTGPWGYNAAIVVFVDVRVLKCHWSNTHTLSVFSTLRTHVHSSIFSLLTRNPARSWNGKHRGGEGNKQCSYPWNNAPDSLVLAHQALHCTMLAHQWRVAPPSTLSDGIKGLLLPATGYWWLPAG